MKIRCIKTKLTEEEFKYSKMTGGSPDFSSSLIIGEEYEVYEISIPDFGMTLYLIENSVVCGDKKSKEGGLLLDTPAALFEISDVSLRGEWVNSFYPNRDDIKNRWYLSVKELSEDIYFVEKYADKNPETIAKFQEIKKRLTS